MPKFSNSQRVTLKQNISKNGKINFVMPLDGGHQHYEVQFDDGTLGYLAEHEILEEVIIKTPWDLLSENLLGDYKNFLISTTMHKVRNTTSNTISSLKASRTIFYPYQYKPLVKFLKSDIKRILVADEVGLGKTIEAGHIMLELAARGDLKNALVICTNSLKDKWKFELQDKFNFTLKKYDTPRDFIEDINNDINSSKKSVFGVVNYEKFRNLKLQEIIEENGYRFDLVICDEAHKIRNSETQQHKGVAKIIDNSDAVVFLTATPIMTDLRNLFNLIRVLDRERYYSYDIFNNAISMNRPFIKALSKLNANTPLLDIANELHHAQIKQEMTADEVVYASILSPISELFKDDELYERARNNMFNGDNSIENKVKIQQDLIELNSLNHIYTRTRKKDVMSAKDVVKREPLTIAISLSDEENQIYNDLINEYDNENNLGLIQRKRQMSSCIPAFRTKREILLNGKYDESLPDAKFEAFASIVQEIVLGNKNKLIVFAFFTNTLLYLKIKLKELGIGTEIIYGGIKDRTDRIENFQHNEDIKILLSSEVGSEGIDLQFCDALVNYDLPWNPMVVEQRIGRIDRVGQKAEVINIYNLILKDTIEERIHNRLYQRINLFRESLGDLEEILGETEPFGELISKGIESLYKTKLTVAEQNEEIDRLRKAIEGEKQTLKKIQTDLAESFANDSHFQNEIESITKNNRYLTKEEIIQYVESIIRIELNSLQISHIDSNISEIILPANNFNSLYNFIEANMDEAIQNPEIHNIYRSFKKNHVGSRKVKITFDQQFAYENRKIEYISAFHPIVNAITNYFYKHEYDKNQAHKIAVNRELIDYNKGVLKGYYLLIIFRINVKRFFGDGKISQEHFLHSTTIDLNEEPKVLPKEVSDHINGVVQLHGEKIQTDINFDIEFVNEIRPFIMIEIKKVENEVSEDEEIKFLSSIKRRTQQEVNYKRSRITRMQSQISEGRGIEQILLSNIEELKQEENQLLFNLERAKIEVDNSLISANLLQVI